MPDGVSPLILTVTCGENLVGLGVVVQNNGNAYLHETGVEAFDALCVEHNMLLVKRGLEKEVVTAAAHFLLHKDNACKEFYVSGVSQLCEKLTPSFDFQGEGLLVDVLNHGPYYVVDLVAAIPYEQQLSRNTRYQINRSLRKYSLFGAIKLTFSQDLLEAELFFKRMVVLHRLYWAKKGKKSGFLSDFSQKFHWNMVTKQHHAGRVNLVKITAGDHEIGYLYLLIKKGTVSVYQTGFHYEPCGQFKPGLVSHYLAILHYQAKGYKQYDLLAGESQYKNSLATGQGHMFWLVFSKNQFFSRIGRCVKAIFRRVTERSTSVK
ncbi:MAG: GNAT family N-acetyltransferase [Gammaproteobacteria bacterium]|nr:GNAT family N-acetyltransferase [Gammaproteobacteria bacterium]